MASRDRNRFRKVYPHKRVRPRLELLASDQSAYVESGFISYAAAATGTHTFVITFPAAPIVVVTSIDHDLNDEANVNTYITAVSTTSVTIETSAAFTGRVHFHAIYQV